MTEISASGNTLQIGNQTVEFEYGIDDLVQLNGIIVVLLNIPTGETNNRNVIGLDQNGSIRWRIEELDSERADKPYVEIDITNGELVADNWMGVQAIVDIDTGAVKDTKLTK